MDLKTIVRGLKAESLANARDDVPLKSAAPRQKRWATKTRSGCGTCRTRRVKCDEAKPFCKRCVLTGRECSYSAQQPSKETKPAAIAPQIEHPDWRIMDAIKYYVVTMLGKTLSYHNPGDSIYVTSYYPNLHIQQIASPQGFIALVVTDRIVNACAAAGVVCRAGELPGIKTLWSTLYHDVDVIIKDLNESIAKGAHVTVLLRNLLNLLSIDLSLMDPAWRAHMEGFAALVKLHGGVKTVFNAGAVLENEKGTPRMALQYGAIYSTLANTVSPANNQITGVGSWSPEELAMAYSHTGFHPAPCPTSVLLDISRITRLRTMTQAESLAVSGFVPIAQQLAKNLQSFIPEEWQEPYSKPEEPCPALAGDLYRTGAILYGILSLPPLLAIEFAVDPQDKGQDTSSMAEYERFAVIENARVSYGNYLLKQVDKAVTELPVLQALSWPIAVLGVARHDAPQEEKDRMLGYLKRLTMLPGHDSGAASVELKLCEFWGFNKTTWDECYYDPINVIT